MATAKTIAPDRPVLDWPAIFFVANFHVGALAALLPGAFSWAVFLHWPTGGAGVTLGCHPLITHRAQQPSRFPEFGSAGSALVARMEDQASALQGCDHRAEDMRALAHA